MGSNPIGATNFMNKTIILILTHRDCLVVKQEFDKLKKDLGEKYDFKILFNRKNSNDLIFLDKEDVYFFDDSIINEIGFYPIAFNKNPFLGNDHFPLFKFAREFSSYDYYWVIEDDVRFSGDWSVFFNTFTIYQNDYIASHFHRDSQNGNLKSFNPIYRLSQKAIKFLDFQFKENKVSGHHEHVLAQILYIFGYEILDFGGLSAFCPEHLREKFYNNTYNGKDFNVYVTHRHGPAFKEIGSIPNKIYHPVKNF